MAQGNVGENDLDAPLDGVIGNSDAMKAVYRLTRQASQSDASVLLLGETGVGKEVIATGVLYRFIDYAAENQS